MWSPSRDNVMPATPPLGWPPSPSGLTSSCSAWARNRLFGQKKWLCFKLCCRQTWLLWRSVVSIITEYANTYAASALAKMLLLLNKRKFKGFIENLFGEESPFKPRPHIQPNKWEGTHMALHSMYRAANFSIKRSIFCASPGNLKPVKKRQHLCDYRNHFWGRSSFSCPCQFPVFLHTFKEFSQGRNKICAGEVQLVNVGIHDLFVESARQRVAWRKHQEQVVPKVRCTKFQTAYFSFSPRKSPMTVLLSLSSVWNHSAMSSGVLPSKFWSCRYWIPFLGFLLNLQRFLHCCRMTFNEYAALCVPCLHGAKNLHVDARFPDFLLLFEDFELFRTVGNVCGRLGQIRRTGVEGGRASVWRRHGSFARVIVVVCVCVRFAVLPWSSKRHHR